MLRTVGEQLRAVPDDGLGYGMLRRQQADADLAGVLAGLPAPQVRFGFAQSPAEGTGCPADPGREPGDAEPPRFVLDELVTVRDPLAARDHILEIDVLAEATQIRSAWTYSRAVHHEGTIRRLMAEYVTELTALAGDSVPRGRSPRPLRPGGPGRFPCSRRPRP